MRSTPNVGWRYIWCTRDAKLVAKQKARRNAHELTMAVVVRMGILLEAGYKDAKDATAMQR